MSDGTVPMPPLREPVIDRYRCWTPRWWNFMRPFFQQTKDNAGQITEVIESIGGVAASWGLELNINNRVVGMIRLNGTENESAFTVLADRFIVVHPTDDNTTIEAFVVGLVNGVPTVGINGNLIVDGTIVARHIDVETISALSANLGTIIAGLIRDEDDTVRFDVPNMRWYRVDGTAEINLLQKFIQFDFDDD
jgi:hypothetical protein